MQDSDSPRRLARFRARVSDNASRACRLVDRRRVADVGIRPDRSWPASGWSSRRTLMPISTALLRCLSYRRVGEWPPRYMGDIVVCGGGVIGLISATMLARDGHRVTVLEADPDATPLGAGRAWEAWQRRGVAQFRQPHNLFARFRQVCDEELPGLTERLVAAGCVWVDYLAAPPPALTGCPPQDGDAALRFVTGRRPVFEAVIAGLAADEPGLGRAARSPAGRAGGGPVGGGRGTARGRGGEHRRRGVEGRPGRGRDGATQPVVAVAYRAGRPRAARTGGGSRVRLLHPLLHRPGPASAARAGVGGPGQRVGADPAWRQRHLVDHRVRRQQRRPAQGPAPSGAVHPASSRPAHCRRTGSTAPRSPTCCRWPGYWIAIAGS